jgi:hypothetical protein
MRYLAGCEAPVTAGGRTGEVNYKEMSRAGNNLSGLTAAGKKPGDRQREASWDNCVSLSEQLDRIPSKKKTTMVDYQMPCLSFAGRVCVDQRNRVANTKVNWAPDAISCMKTATASKCVLIDSDTYALTCYRTKQEPNSLAYRTTIQA